MKRSITATLRVFLVLLCLTVGTAASAMLHLPKMFADGMVVQRNRPIRIWGQADAGAMVNVSLQTDVARGKAKLHTLGQAEAKADADGRWQVELPSLKAMGPLRLTVTAGSDRQELADVWVGDVWLCSGQSNVDVNIERVYPQYVSEIDADATDRVRLFRVENEAVLDAPRSDVRSSGWATLSKQNAWKFSALGYFLGKRMLRTQGVVQGIVQCSWGGTPIESWLPREVVRPFDSRMASEAEYYADPDLRRLSMEANRKASQRWDKVLEEADPGISGQWTRTDLNDRRWTRASQYDLPVQPAYGFCGTYWMRQHISIDAAHAGQKAQLLLGTLVDADFTYLNGQLVGHTGYQYPPRRYTIPEGLLREGDNVLTVRFVNRGQRPQFIREKPYKIVWADGSEQPLAEEWLVHDGTQMPQMPQMPTSYQNMAGAAFNGMLSPLAPMPVAGVVWYQGESNTGRAEVYEQELTQLMKVWRERFQQPEMPFVIVQLANYMAPSERPQETGWARLRESQRRAALADAHAALAVAIDLGEANDIHPLRKKEVAERVAQGFDRLVFGSKLPLSPQPIALKNMGDGTMQVTFDQPLTEGELKGFELAGPEGRFRNVEAKAKGANVILIGTGTRVRYAWKNNPVEANCRAAGDGLPASPFEMELPQPRYPNPMLWADVPDPDVIRVGDQFYMVSTTMHLMPGAPVMRSRDLVNWETVGYVFDRLTDSPKYDMQEGTVYGRGQWATSLKYHKGRFYALFAPNDNPGGDTYICTAERAEGPWTLVSRMRHFHDATLFFDDDDRVYVFYGTGQMCELKGDLTGVKEGTDCRLFERDGDERGLLEGSRVIKHNGKYYLMMISWTGGHPRREVCYRADNIRGPYEKKVILETEFAGFGGVGQGTIVDDTEGNWYGVIFQDRGGVGRVLTLEPCRWQDGWPMLGDEKGRIPEFIDGSWLKTLKGNEPLKQQRLTLSDDFSGSKLGLQWQWNHNPVDQAWSLTDRKGWLRLKTSRLAPNLFLAPNTLTQRMEGPTCSATVCIDYGHMKDGDCAGFSAFNGDAGVLTIKCKGKAFTLEMSEQSVQLTDREKAVTKVDEQVKESVGLSSKAKKVWLRIDGDFRNHRDAANFYFSLDGKQWTRIGTADYKMRFDYRRLFMGTKFAIFNYATKQSGGWVDVNDFRYVVE